MTYSEKVIKLTEEANLKPYGLAKEIGANPRSATNWFKRGAIPCGFAVKIARFFKVDLESLLDDELPIKEK